MKRDMNLIRQLAFQIEAADEDIDSTTIELDGYSPDEIGYHCELMKEAGLIKAHDTTCLTSAYSEMIILRLTWAGHDFLSAAADDTTWNKVTRRIQDRATEMTFDGLVGTLKAAGIAMLGPVTEWISQ